MNCVCKQVFLYWVILSSVINAGYWERTCETLEDCYGSTEYSQLYYKTYLDPNSPNYDPSDICENSNSVKEWCRGKSNQFIQEDAICGQVNSEEIIIGPKTRINEFPWMALLQYTDGKTIETTCQGVLITNLLVMTSATCLKPNTNGFNLTSVILGEWDKSTVVDCDNSSGVCICNDPPIVVPILWSSIHNYFNNSNDHKHNTGLIQLEQIVEYTDFIKPICLPYFVTKVLSRQFYPGRRFEIASWGETARGANKSGILLKVDLLAVPCPSDSDKDLCIQSTLKRNVCGGDEGAPIMGRTTKGNRTYVYLAGIVSHSNSCGPNEGPIFLGDAVKW